MFRITRGMHVQHVQFPFPLFGRRDLDDLTDDEQDDTAPQKSATPPTAENAAEPAADQT